MLRLATKAGSAAPPAAGDSRGGLPPEVIRQVAAERGAHGGSHLPIEGGKQVLIVQIPFDAHVIHELGHVSALPGEEHLSGSVINADDRKAHLVTGSHRLPGPQIDVLTGAEGGPQRRGARVRAEDVDGCRARTACPTLRTPSCALVGTADARSS